MDRELRLPLVLLDGATPPEYATPGAAGMDVRAIDPIHLEPMERKLVRTGLRMAVPPGYEAQMRPRSGLALRYGLTMANSPGTIDSDFRGELKIILVNLGSETIRLDAGERIGQIVVCPVMRAEWALVKDLDDTERGEGGFGSTGTE